MIKTKIKIYLIFLLKNNQIKLSLWILIQPKFNGSFKISKFAKTLSTQDHFYLKHTNPISILKLIP